MIFSSLKVRLEQHRTAQSRYYAPQTAGALVVAVKLNQVRAVLLAQLVRELRFSDSLEEVGKISSHVTPFRGVDLLLFHTSKTSGCYTDHTDHTDYTDYTDQTDQTDQTDHIAHISHRPKQTISHTDHTDRTYYFRGYASSVL